MKLLSVNTARALWFFHTNDLNPRGRAVERDIYAGLAKRYSFKIPDPKEMAELRQKGGGVVFSDGLFAKDKATPAIQVNLTVYRDAMFADTRSSTTDSDAFLDDLLNWMHSEIGLLDYKSIAIRRLYVSEVYISLEKSLNKFNRQFDEFAKFLASKIKGPTKNLSLEVGALAFWIDPEIKHVHIPFRLERQDGSAFDEGRYYSMAPLETEEHLAAIEQLEKMMA